MTASIGIARHVLDQDTQTDPIQETEQSRSGINYENVFVIQQIFITTAIMSYCCLAAAPYLTILGVGAFCYKTLSPFLPDQVRKVVYQAILPLCIGILLGVARLSSPLHAGCAIVGLCAPMIMKYCVQATIKEFA